MGRTHTVTRRVEFRDTDAAGIAHFSTFFTAFEAAEHDLLRSLGLSVKLAVEGGTVSFPRVSASCQYRRPLTFEQRYAIEVAVGRLGRSSVTYVGTFRELDAATGDILTDTPPIAEATVTAVCVRLDADGPMAAVELPTVVRTALAPYLISADTSDGAADDRTASQGDSGPTRWIGRLDNR